MLEAEAALPAKKRKKSVKARQMKWRQHKQNELKRKKVIAATSIQVPEKLQVRTMDNLEQNPELLSSASAQVARSVQASTAARKQREHKRLQHLFVLKKMEATIERLKR